MYRLLHINTKQQITASASYRSSQQLKKYAAKIKDTPEALKPISFAIGGINIESDENIEGIYDTVTTTLSTQRKKDYLGLNVTEDPQGNLELRAQYSLLKKQIAGLEVNPENVVMLAGGGKGAIDTVLNTLLRRERKAPPAKAALILPAWCSYTALIESAGGEPVFLNTNASEGYKISPEKLRRFLRQADSVESQIAEFTTAFQQLSLKEQNTAATAINAVFKQNTAIPPMDFINNTQLEEQLTSAVKVLFPNEREPFETLLTALQDPSSGLPNNHPFASYKSSVDVYIHQRVSNPKGVAYTREELEEIVTICKELRVVIVEDNAYSQHISNPDKYPSILSIPGATDEVISIEEVSKDNTLRGLRAGIMIGPEKAAKAVADRVRDTSSFLAAPVQRVLSIAFINRLNGQYSHQHIKTPRQNLLWAADFFKDSLLTPEVPEHGYFLTLSFDQRLFRSGTEAVDYLIDNKGIACVEGEAFDGGRSDKPWIRLALGGVSQQELEEGCNRIKATFLDREKVVSTSPVANDQHNTSENIEAFCRKGFALLRERNFVGSAEAFTQAITLGANDATIFRNRGMVRLGAGQYIEAESDLTLAIKLSANDVEAFHNRGVSRFYQNNFAGAEADFTKAITLGANSVEIVRVLTFRTRGRVRLQQSNFAVAEEDFTQAITLGAINTRIFHERGVARLRQDNFVGAEKDFTQAITLDASNFDALIGRGESRLRQDNLAGAEADYTQAIILDANNVEALTGRGAVRIAQGNYIEAEEDFTQIITLDANHVGSLRNRGMVRALQGNNLGAQEDFARAEAIVEHISIPPLTQIFATAPIVHQGPTSVQQVKYQSSRI